MRGGGFGAGTALGGGVLLSDRLRREEAPRSSAGVSSTIPLTTPPETRQTSEPALPVVAAVERHAMPRCEAGELRSLASLTDGIRAQAALATRPDGAVVAYVTDGNHDGHKELMLIALDEHGVPRRAPIEVRTVGEPELPAVAATHDGYLLVWRAAAASGESIARRGLDAAGTPTGANVATEPAWFGPPAVAATAEHAWIAEARSVSAPRDPEARSTSDIGWIDVTDNVAGTSHSPSGTLFDADHPPALVANAQALDVWAPLVSSAADHAPAGVALVSPHAAARWIAQDSAGASALLAPGGEFVAWRTRSGAHNIVARVAAWSGDVGVPWTIATYRGAFDADVQLAALGDDLVAAFTISTLADDDAGGALNVSVLTTANDYVGRQPLITSTILRNARVVHATMGAMEWFVVEGRADTGAPALGLIQVSCSTEHPMDPLEIPSAGLEQRLAHLDDPLVHIEATPSLGTCHAAGSSTFFARHYSGEQNALAGTDVAAVARAQATSMFAIVRDEHGSSAHVVAGVLNPHGAVEPRGSALDGSRRIPCIRQCRCGCSGRGDGW